MNFFVETFRPQMKKLVIVFGALIMGFLVISCGNSSKDVMVADIDAYFEQAHENLAAIDNAEDFLDYAAKMSDGSDIEKYLLEKWDNNMKISDKDYNYIVDYAKEKSTDYFLAEKEKGLQLVEPSIARFNDLIINKMYPMYQDHRRFDNQTMEDFLDDFNYIRMFLDYQAIMDVLEVELKEATDKMAEMTPVINQRIEEMYQ